MTRQIAAGILAASAAILIAAACDGASGSLGPAIDAGLKSCSAGTAIFTKAPIVLDSMAGWVPLGNLNPPAHTFPTDHQYLYLPFTSITSVPAAVGVVAPGHVFVTRARRTVYNTRPTADYAVEFSPCSNVYAEFGHLQTLTPAMLDRLGPFDQGCQTYSPDPATTVTSCYTKLLAVEMAAGEAMGTTGGVPGVFGMDFLLFDNRVDVLSYANDARWTRTSDGFDHFHVAPASEYFAEPARSQIAVKLGSADGQTSRVTAPIGGTIATDVPGSAQGTWFNASQPTYPESPHLAIVPDNVDPSTFVFSIGTSQPGASPGSRAFVPTNAGAVNRRPSDVAANGLVYCYSFGGSGIILLQLVTPNSLRVEYRPGSANCGTGPFTITGSTFDYVR